MHPPDVHARACAGDGVLSVMLWHYHDDDLPGAYETVTLSITGLPRDGRPVVLRHYRIDETHSNAHTAWLQMGAPQAPSAAQYAALDRASELALLESPRWLRANDSPGTQVIDVSLPRQSVSLCGECVFVFFTMGLLPFGRGLSLTDVMTASLVTRPVSQAGFPRWKPLWDGYNAFYGRAGSTALPDEVTRVTWMRFFDPYEPMHAFVAEQDGQLLGMTHVLFHRSTVQIHPSCYLQDLFTAEAARGKGVGRAVINHVYDFAKAARRIAQRHGVELYLERELIETDLFPADVARGMHVLLIYRGDVLARYQALKQDRARLMQGRGYAGQPRREIAQGFGRLLSYSDTKIEALIAAQTAH